MRLLLVEDDPDAARVLAKGLKELGYAVDVAGDGHAAVAQADVVDYDAVVLDIMLPGLDGFAACRAIRESGCAVPILMLTARDAVESRIEGLDSGADDYLETSRASTQTRRDRVSSTSAPAVRRSGRPTMRLHDAAAARPPHAVRHGGAHRRIVRVCG